jgi:phosphohistidine phosphatase
MKTLFLLRHAKSSWENSNLTDFERPLNKRGLNAAPFMGEKILYNRFQIDLILSSPAERARQTTILVKETALINSTIQYDRRIYEAGARQLLEVVSETNKDKNSIMLVGHNPGMEQLVEILTGETQTMPTAALAVIDLRIKRWKEISKRCGTLRKMIRPKDEMVALEENG